MNPKDRVVLRAMIYEWLRANAGPEKPTPSLAALCNEVGEQALDEIGGGNRPSTIERYLREMIGEGAPYELHPWWGSMPRSMREIRYKVKSPQEGSP